MEEPLDFSCSKIWESDATFRFTAPGRPKINNLILKCRNSFVID